MSCPFTVAVFAMVGAANTTTRAAVDRYGEYRFHQSPLPAETQKSLSPTSQGDAQNLKLSRRFYRTGVRHTYC